MDLPRIAKSLGTGTIRPGAAVGQDFGYAEWPKFFGGESVKETIFQVERSGPETCLCRAHGFGVHGTRDGSGYGNGALFVKLKDIRFVEEAT